MLIRIVLNFYLLFIVKGKFWSHCRLYNVLSLVVVVGTIRI